VNPPTKKKKIKTQMNKQMNSIKKGVANLLKPKKRKGA